MWHAFFSFALIFFSFSSFFVMLCVNVFSTWLPPFNLSLCSSGTTTTCRTILWLIYSLFVYDVCVWRIKFDWLIDWTFYSYTSIVIFTKVEWQSFMGQKRVLVTLYYCSVWNNVHVYYYDISSSATIDNDILWKITSSLCSHYHPLSVAAAAAAAIWQYEHIDIRVMYWWAMLPFRIFRCFRCVQL